MWSYAFLGSCAGCCGFCSCGAGVAGFWGPAAGLAGFFAISRSPNKLIRFMPRPPRSQQNLAWSQKSLALAASCNCRAADKPSINLSAARPGGRPWSFHLVGRQTTVTVTGDGGCFAHGRTPPAAHALLGRRPMKDANSVCSECGTNLATVRRGLMCNSCRRSFCEECRIMHYEFQASGRIRCRFTHQEVDSPPLPL